MKKILSTITMALIVCSANVGHTTNKIELNDLPDELKMKISLQLPCDNQSELAMTNKSFNNIMTDKIILISKTAQKFGLNFDEMNKFSKDFIDNVRTGNFVFEIVDNNIYPESMMTSDNEERNFTCHSLGNNGHISTIKLKLENYKHLRNDDDFRFDAASSDGTTFVGDYNKSSPCVQVSVHMGIIR